jgi:hypothetical protein
LDLDLDLENLDEFENSQTGFISVAAGFPPDTFALEQMEVALQQH